MIRKKHFTLVELLIVLTLIVTVVTVVGINVTQAVKKERFKMGVEQVKSKLTLAQNLMLLLNTDVRVTFEIDQNRALKCFLEVEKPLNPALAKMIHQQPVISGFSKITFEEGETHKMIESPVVLHFASGGTKMSQGVLNLYMKDEVEKITLLGYPTPIGSKVKQDDKEQDHYESLYPKEVKILIEQSL